MPDMQAETLDLVGALMVEDARISSPAKVHRFGVLTLVRDPRHRVLMVKAATEDTWRLPGFNGGVQEGESVSDAAERVLLEATGLERTITHVLAVDQVDSVPRLVPQDRFNWVCDGGVVTVDEARNTCLPETAVPALEGLTWIELEELPHYTEPPHVKCIIEALSSLSYGMGLPLLEFGERAEARKAAA
ncbi:NUDIX domain-containing protein [Streptomyces sp. CFMR 7]|uniref:NUDIX domain-containing protein n=1 Tax=Streptomyces sp. CFMR 7 TaxID=1649184 RepID=UPI0011A26641|nr:NUDIX hydrolase [Streptomyces sp. CFMR 7]